MVLIYTLYEFWGSQNIVKRKTHGILWTWWLYTRY